MAGIDSLKAVLGESAIFPGTENIEAQFNSKVTKSKEAILAQAPASSKEDKWKALKAVEAALNKQFSTTTALVKLGGKVGTLMPSVSTGIWTLDYEVIQTGGLPKGRIIEFYGPECLSGNTFINYSVRDESGKRVNNKGGTLLCLYERFNGLRKDGRCLRHKKSSYKYYAPCMNDEGSIFHNRITNVVHAGIKTCFEVFTESGERIVASEEHKFLTPDMGWVALKDLVAGSKVLIHNKTPFTVDNYESIHRRTIAVKQHGVAYCKQQKDSKTGKTYNYYILRYARAIVEASLNNMSLEKYIDTLNNGKIVGLKFLPRNTHVHHIDENPNNNNLDNLLLLTASDHGKLHALDRKKNLSYMAVATTVQEIRHLGPVDTFDVSMEHPHNNFVADGFIVHNSGGKTTLALQAVKEVQKAGGICAYIDAEHALDPNYMKQTGVDVDQLLVSQPDSGEQALETLEALVDSGAIDLAVVDSVAALVPQAELDGEMGDSVMGLHARLMSQAMRKLRGKCALKGVTVIFINQIREKIGVMFGSPETTTGGRALKFYASVRLDVRRIGGDAGKITSGGIVVGHKIKLRAVKNKVGTPAKETEIDLIYGRGIDTESDFVNYAVKVGAIQRSGAWYSFEGKKLGQGIDNAAATVLGDQDLLSSIKATVLKVLADQREAE